ncbi:MAG: S1/P1 nuclease [Gammaproteobacteria bacterium]|nr:S1/P1 nuclease [Gammaproteobacteria bacterium]
MKFILSLVSLCISTTCLSWGQTGHRVTGEIAQNYLSPEAKAAIKSIIGNESLAEASTYADEQRSNPEHFWQEVAGSYHYVTVPAGKMYNDVKAPKKGDSVTALEQFKATLKNTKASQVEKQLALKFIVHIIGDLHQPLHAGNGLDRGGNDVKVNFFWEDSNLHRVWDSGLIDRQKLSYSEWSAFLNRTITDSDLKAWSSTNPVNWITESAEIRDSIYPKDEKLSWDYNYEHLPTIKTRLKQAGVRIAFFFNEVFK